MTTDPQAILAALIRCPSVTPREGGALTVLEEILSPLGFSIERPLFCDEGTPDVENLYARLGDGGPNLMFAGHTDVVPPGDEALWTHPPFSADIADGEMYGRGAVDMKGGIACFIAALARHIEETGAAPTGSVSLLITGDEEGPSINGSGKLLQWAAEKGETWDAAIVGEPTNARILGDMVKIGRRGSLSGTLTVHGVQGHAAYPHLADNPLRALIAIADALLDPPLDAGTSRFQPTNLEITSIDTGNAAVNVIPASATARFNIRFNDNWTVDSLKAEIGKRIAGAAEQMRLRPGKQEPARYAIDWQTRPGDAFVTSDAKLTDTLGGAIAAVTGRHPELSTTGGTSDARYIKDYCPVVEFGLVGRTMHMADERVALEDLETLTQIYQRFIADWFG